MVRDMAEPPKSRQIHLVSRPQGEPTLDDFELVDAQVADPADGEVMVANRFISVDPYMRGRMRDRQSYVPPFELGQPMDGGAVGEVVASNAADVQVGDMVVHNKGWRELAVVAARHVQPAATDVALSANLGVVGMTGMTAYVGLLHIAEMQPGETVFFSGAAGVVGSVAGPRSRRSRARLASSGQPGPMRRSISFNRNSGSTPHSTIVTVRLTTSCTRPPPTASMCTSTTSVAIIYRRRWGH
ncbi:hypothetical protein BH24ACT15_BH24ACT15_35000 [soil metagenome]